MTDFTRNVPPGANNPMPRNPHIGPVTVDPRSRPAPTPITPLQPPSPGQPWSAPPVAPSPNVRPMR